MIKKAFIDLLNEPLWIRLMIAFVGLIVIPFLGTITAMILSYT